MLKRRFFFVAVLGLAALSAPPRLCAADAAAPTLVVRVRSIDSLLADLKYLTSVAGRGDEAKQLDAQLKKAFPKGFQGIDSKRPLGLYAFLDADGVLKESKVVVLLPVSDEKTFIGVLENFNLKPAKNDDGTYTISADNLPVPIHLRFANNYAYFSALHKSPLDKDKLIPPGKIFSESYPELISASFRIDQIPDTHRKLAIGAAEVHISSVEEEKPAGETQVQHHFKVQAAKEITKHFETVLKEGEELTVRLDVNRTARELAVELGLSGKPDSSIASTFKALGSSESAFAGLLSADAALNLIVHGALPEPLRKALGPVIDEGARTGLEKEKDPARRAQGEKLLKALSPSLKSGELDAAVTLRGPGEGKHYTLVAALKLKDGNDIDGVVRDLIKGLPEDARKLIKLDADSAGDVKIHRLDVQQAFDEDARKTFGDNPFYVALRPDALLVAGGEGGLHALKEALSVKPGVAPPVELDLSLARFVPLMGKKQKTDPAAAAQKAFGDDREHDKLHVRLEGGKALKISVKMDAAVLKFFGLMENKKSKD
jgi:hypothetical protein